MHVVCVEVCRCDARVSSVVLQGALKAVVRAVPVAVLQPLIGTTEAVAKTLFGSCCVCVTVVGGRRRGGRGAPTG
jgi:hypothetical protein